jgi:hypothetical protein
MDFVSSWHRFFERHSEYHSARHSEYLFAPRSPAGVHAASMSPPARAPVNAATKLHQFAREKIHQ